MEQTAKNTALEIAEILKNKGATDIQLIDVTKQTIITDYFLIATGKKTCRTSRHCMRKSKIKWRNRANLRAGLKAQKKRVGLLWIIKMCYYTSSIKKSVSSTALRIFGPMETTSKESDKLK